MDVYYQSDGTAAPHRFTEDKVYQLNRDEYDLVGTDSEADTAEDVFSRWQAKDSGDMAPEFTKGRYCDTCEESFETAEAARAAHGSEERVVDVWETGEKDPQVHNLFGWPRSMSVGDVIDTGDGLVVCAPIGFRDAEWA